MTLEDAQIRAGAYAGQEMPLVPGVQASAGLSWDAGQKAVYSARLNHVGKRRYGDDYGNDAGYLSGYTTLDLMASWRIRDWKIDARVLNAADERYAAYAGYGFNSTTLANDTFYYPADGRTFGMTARYDFR